MVDTRTSKLRALEAANAALQAENRLLTAALEVANHEFDIAIALAVRLYERLNKDTTP